MPMNGVRLKILMIHGHDRYCPVPEGTDGSERERSEHELGNPDWGYSCRKCHRTWEWDQNVLKATWPKEEKKDEAERS